MSAVCICEKYTPAGWPNPEQSDSSHATDGAAGVTAAGRAGPSTPLAAQMPMFPDTNGVHPPSAGRIAAPAPARLKPADYGSPYDVSVNIRATPAYDPTAPNFWLYVSLGSICVNIGLLVLVFAQSAAAKITMTTLMCIATVAIKVLYDYRVHRYNARVEKDYRYRVQTA